MFCFGQKFIFPIKVLIAGILYLDQHNSTGCLMDMTFVIPKFPLLQITQILFPIPLVIWLAKVIIL